jgi:heme/copper-type cytochrome/quinol oxidase subunit 2
MEENTQTPQKSAETIMPVAPAPKLTEEAHPQENGETLSRGKIIMIVAGVMVLVILIIAALAFLYTKGPDVTGRVRDIFIIFMALESLVIGVALIILIVQLALLTNLLQNEIKPIIDSTNETVSTIRGTAAFLSDNLAEPVIKINEYLAYLKKITDLLNFGKKK